MKRYRIAFMTVILHILWQGSAAQDYYWPVEFGNPDSSDKITVSVPDSSVAEQTETKPAAEEESVDSSALMISGKTTYYQMFKAHSRIDWQRLLPDGQLEQTASYQYNQLSPGSSIQTLDGSGNVMFHNVRNSSLDAGFLWTPIGRYDRQHVGRFMSSADLGPVLSGALGEVPFIVKGGLHGYAWNDSITPRLFSTTDGRYHASPGVFGGIECGSDETPLGFAPVYFSLSATGRSIDNNNLGLMRSGLLYADETGFLGGGDSLYLSLSDSITNGREIYTGEFGVNSFYSNTSWRLNHSFAGTAGIRLHERFATVFRSYYRYNLHSISYQNMVTDMLKYSILPQETPPIDTRTTSHLFGMSARSREGLPLVYRGGIEFGWEFEDKFCRLNFGENDYPDKAVRELYIINQNDHYTDRARTDHDLLLTLPAGFGVQYHLSSVKDSKRYPFVFRESLTEKRRNENENDRVQTDHQLSLRFDRDTTVSVNLYGKYGRMHHYYYHENRAAESRITDEYRAGINAGFTLGPVSLREHFYMDAEISDYYFKKIGDKTVDAPPYSRDFSSSLSGEWRISDQLFLNGTWLNLYRDDGYWYGEAYRSDTAADGPEYYAIERKGTQYWVDLWLKWQTVDSSRIISVGSKFRDIFERRYDFDRGEFVISELDIGYGIEPYMKVALETDSYGGKFIVRRIFNTGDAERWSKRKNWDVSISFQVYW